MTQKTLNTVATLNRHFLSLTQGEIKEKIRKFKEDKKMLFLFELNFFSAFAYKDFFVLIGEIKKSNWFSIIAFSSREDLEDFVFNNIDV